MERDSLNTSNIARDNNSFMIRKQDKAEAGTKRASLIFQIL